MSQLNKKINTIKANTRTWTYYLNKVPIFRLPTHISDPVDAVCPICRVGKFKISKPSIKR
ncbi:hypothetical protein NQ318_015751 [Aromia moschata]|uniref:Uncharacterized protein n=1 Tax=Aromia moschata TaxID=1265417 RepID=A0AAV8X6T3_9CUCU|nr:hypothetical protein NQ318_015751 [Aromia moschata]